MEKKFFNQQKSILERSISAKEGHAVNLVGVLQAVENGISMTRFL